MAVWLLYYCSSEGAFGEVRLACSYYTVGRRRVVHISWYHVGIHSVAVELFTTWASLTCAVDCCCDYSTPVYDSMLYNIAHTARVALGSCHDTILDCTARSLCRNAHFASGGRPSRSSKAVIHAWMSFFSPLRSVFKLVRSLLSIALRRRESLGT